MLRAYLAHKTRRKEQRPPQLMAHGTGAQIPPQAAWAAARDHFRAAHSPERIIIIYCGGTAAESKATRVRVAILQQLLLPAQL